MNRFSTLIRDAIAGNEDAVEEIISLYRPTIEQECARFGTWNNPELSQSDLRQEVMIRVWSKLHQFNGADHEHALALFESWLRKTARAVLANLHRDRLAQKRHANKGVRELDDATLTHQVPDIHGQKSPSSVAAANEDIHRMKEIIAESLDDQTREILMMHVVDGYSIAEISKQTGLSYDQVRYRYEQAIKKLEKRMS